MTTYLKTVALGILGLVVAAALGYFALELVSQPVGLNSQPVTVGDDLVPQKDPTDKKKPEKKSPGSTDDTADPSGTPKPDDNKVDDDSGGGDDRDDGDGEDHDGDDD